MFVETESLFYFCIGTKVSFRGEKSKFWWGESLYLSANAHSLSFFIWNRIFRKKTSVAGGGRSSIMGDDVSFMQKNMPQFALFVNKSLLCTNFKETMQSQEMRSKYNLRSNEFHSGAVSFSFFEKDIFSSLVMR